MSLWVELEIVIPPNNNCSITKILNHVYGRGGYTKSLKRGDNGYNSAFVRVNDDGQEALRRVLKLRNMLGDNCKNGYPSVLVTSLTL